MKPLSEINPRTELYMLDCKGLKLFLTYFVQTHYSDLDIPHYYPSFIHELISGYKASRSLRSAVGIQTRQEIDQHIRKAASYFRNLVRAEMTRRNCPGNYKKTYDKKLKDCHA